MPELQMFYITADVILRKPKRVVSASSERSFRAYAREFGVTARSAEEALGFIARDLRDGGLDATRSEIEELRNLRQIDADLLRAGGDPGKLGIWHKGPRLLLLGEPQARERRGT